jgi:hypothetical protein
VWNADERWHVLIRARETLDDPNAHDFSASIRSTTFRDARFERFLPSDAIVYANGVDLHVTALRGGYAREMSFALDGPSCVQFSLVIDGAPVRAHVGARDVRPKGDEFALCP